MNTLVVVLAYNRPQHTSEVLTNLSREGFQQIRLYLDGPKTEKDKLLQSEILQIAADCPIEVEVIRRKRSLGLARSIVEAVSHALKEYPQVIVLEDDCVPLPGFRHYMLTALEQYKDCKKIRSINAYTYPCVNPSTIEGDVFLSERFCPWGWATWSDRWEDYQTTLAPLVKRMELERRSLSHLGKDIEQYCKDSRFLNMEVDIWSLNWILIHSLTDSLVLYPSRSLINNIGFDGSGVHSATTDVFSVTHSKKQRPLPNVMLRQLEVHNEAQNNMISFLEGVSKMTMLLNSSKLSRKITVDEAPLPPAPSWVDQPKTWIIPAAGMGTRTRELGACKPLIRIAGASIFHWLIKSLMRHIRPEDHIVVVTTSEFATQLAFEEEIQSVLEQEAIATPLSLVIAEETPCGPAASVYLTRDVVKPEHPVIVVNSDQFIDFSLPDSFEEKSGFLAVTMSTDPSKSYVCLNEAHEITEVVEKQVVSPLASTGVYALSRASLLFAALERQFSEEATVNGEYYVGPALNYLLEKGVTMRPTCTKVRYDLGTTQRILDFGDIVRSFNTRAPTLTVQEKRQ